MTGWRVSTLPCPPRWGTERSPERATFGPAIGRVAASLGKPLMPHQQLIADVSHEIDPETGELAFDTVVAVINRQMGKSELLLPVMTHRAIGQFAKRHGGQRLLYAAQTGDEAKKKWRDHHLARLQESPLRSLFTQRERLNFEAIMFHNGSMWSPMATTAKTGGTGDQTDLGVLDEGWVHDDTRAEQGIVPTMLTRASPQLWITSMVPGPTRVREAGRASATKSRYLRAKIAEGKAAVEAGSRRGTAFFFWCASPDDDLDDPAVWLSCMPAVCPAWPCRCAGDGSWRHTVPLSAIERDHRRMAAADFAAEYLGLWPDEQQLRWRVIGQQEWADRLRPDLAVSGRPALGVWVPPDRDWCAIVAAGRRAGGGGRLIEITGNRRENVFDYRPGTAWAVGRLADLWEREPQPLVVVTNDKALGGQLVEAGVPAHVATAGEVAAGCAMLFDGVAGADLAGRDVWHPGQPEMGLAVSASRKRTQGQVWVLDQAEAGEDISPAPAAGLALWGLATSRVWVERPVPVGRPRVRWM